MHMQPARGALFATYGCSTRDVSCWGIACMCCCRGRHGYTIAREVAARRCKVLCVRFYACGNAQVTRLFEHQLEHTAANMAVGAFGSGKSGAHDCNLCPAASSTAVCRLRAVLQCRAAVSARVLLCSRSPSTYRLGPPSEPQSG